MKALKQVITMFAAITFVTLAQTGYAASDSLTDSAMDYGQYTVHYNAFTTDTLVPQVAKTYGIQRSANRALLNITVLKKVMGTTGQPVPAKVTASATNLTGQYRELEIREVREGNAIYYISDFRVTDRETLDFKVKIAVDDKPAPYELNFRQQFYTR